MKLRQIIEGIINERTCSSCTHFEMMEGKPKCEKGVFPTPKKKLTTKEYRRILLTAETCKQYESIK